MCLPAPDPCCFGYCLRGGADMDVDTTFEGDNTVLMQQVGGVNELLSEWVETFNGTRPRCSCRRRNACLPGAMPTAAARPI